MLSICLGIFILQWFLNYRSTSANTWEMITLPQVSKEATERGTNL